MKTTSNMNLEDFPAWSGGLETKEIIIEHGKAKDFDMMIDELYPDGIDEAGLNDLLWHDSDWVLDTLRIELD